MESIFAVALLGVIRKMNRLFLVSCVKTKLSTDAKAADLYTSAWFKKVRALVEKTGAPWFILSPEYGLLSPERMVATYERELSRFVAERRAWASDVINAMEANLPEADEVVIFAGKKYWEYLLPYLKDRYPKVRVPMEGLKRGHQLRWLCESKAI